MNEEMGFGGFFLFVLLLRPSSHVPSLGLAMPFVLQTFPLAAETGLDTIGQG